MKKRLAILLSIAMMTVMIFSPTIRAQGVQAGIETKPGIQYKTHIQDYGWEANWRSNGALSGSVGESKRLEAVIVKLTGELPEGADVKTYVHVQNIGDMGPFEMGSQAGTSGRGYRLENIRLVINNMPGFGLLYNVQVQDKGWLRDIDKEETWFKDGETAGTSGESLRLEGFKLKVVEVNEDYEAYLSTLAAAKESDYTQESWVVYKKVVDANQVTKDNTNDEIKKATANIMEAQKNLISSKNMADYNRVLGAVKEADYVPESWAAYRDIVSQNIVTLKNTQAQIDEATKTIFEAQKKLEKKVNLTDYKAALEAVRADDYTAKSWETYQEAVAANGVSEDNSQTEVDEATKKIKNAQKKLVRIFDFTRYNELLNRVKEEDYVAATWSVYEDVLAANRVDENNTQSDIEKAITKIEKAQEKLIKKADLSYYNAILNAVAKEDYTTDSWNEYQGEVRSIRVNALSKKEVVDQAVVKIMEAQLNLEPLGNLIYYYMATNNVNPNNYTFDSWDKYQKIVDANRVIPKDGQEAIDQATEKIEAAQKKLVKIGDLSEYKKILASVNKDTYTTDSWEKYQKVLDSSYLSDREDQTTIDKTIKKIEAAQKKLVKIGDLSEYNKILASVNKGIYTTDSWEKYQKVLDSSYLSDREDQATIDKAIKKIGAAQRKLVEKGNLAEYNNVLAEVDPKDYTTASWQTYTKVLDSNYMDDDRSQSEIDKAISNIKRAQKKLDSVGDLTEYNKILLYNLAREPNEEGPIPMKLVDYTPSSWAVYDKVVTSNYMDRDKSQAQIDKAVLNIERAQSKLILRADKSLYDEYKKLLEDYWVERDSYTTASWNKYQEVVDENVMTPENSEAEINGAILKIKRAQQYLEEKSDTSQYDDVYHKYDGKENLFTTAGWQAYQKVLDDKSNILTVEDSKAAIKAAIKRIETAQGKLELSRVPGILETYKTIIEECEKKRRDYTDESWREYQLVVSENYVNKDSSEREINEAIGKVADAQLKLVRSKNTKALFSAISLYQENELQDEANKYSKHVSPDSWQAYADSVNKYVSFKNGAWDPYGPKEHNITYDSSQVMINKAVENIEATKAAFVYIFAEEFQAYDQAIKLASGKIADDYTIDSYSYYETVRRENEILDDDRIKLDKADITKRTANIVDAKEVLTPRANPSTVAKFDYEIDQYNQKNTHDRDWDAKMGQLVIWYTKSTWDAYSTQYKKYSIDPNTRLDPANDTNYAYNEAITALETKREALKITAKHAAFDLNEWASGLRLNSVSTGMNVLNVAKTYVKDDNFELSIPEGIDERVSSTGVISGKSGDKVNIRFELKEKEDAGNSWGETYYNIVISNEILTPPDEE